MIWIPRRVCVQYLKTLTWGKRLNCFEIEPFKVKISSCSTETTWSRTEAYRIFVNDGYRSLFYIWSSSRAPLMWCCHVLSWKGHLNAEHVYIPNNSAFVYRDIVRSIVHIVVILHQWYPCNASTIGHMGWIWTTTPQQWPPALDNHFSSSRINARNILPCHWWSHPGFSLYLEHPSKQAARQSWHCIQDLGGHRVSVRPSENQSSSQVNRDAKMSIIHHRTIGEVGNKGTRATRDYCAFEKPSGIITHQRFDGPRSDTPIPFPHCSNLEFPL